MVSICNLRHLFLNWVQSLTTFIDGTLTVCHDNILKSHGNEKLNNSNSSSARSGSDDLNVLDVLSNNLQGIDHACQCDNSSTMLIIMENRNVTALFQLLLNLKTSWCRNILQVYPAKASCKKAYCLNDLIHILTANAKRNGIYVSKLFKQNTLTFHNRHTSFRANIAKSQNCSTVCYNSNCIPASGKLIAFINIFLNFKARLCNTWSIGKA